MKKILGKVAQLADDFEASSGIEASIFDADFKLFVKGYEKKYCEGCNCDNRCCDPVHTHTYGFFESDRWGGLYIYHCPRGLTFVNSIIYSEKAPIYSIILGPILMDAYPEVVKELRCKSQRDLSEIVHKSPREVTAIARILNVATKGISESSFDDYYSAQRLNSDNTMYDMAQEIDLEKYSAYSIDAENKLQNMIVRGDKQGAKELINDLLGYIFFESDGNFASIKSRVIELVVLFSRAAISGGAGARQVFLEKNSIIETIGKFDSIYDLSDYLGKVFNQFVGYVFDYESVENVNIIYKALRFIKDNYTNKISLQDVADHVHLSKSYFSKVFKENVSVSFIDYLNQLRIDKSKQLLLDPELSIADISNIMGFTDQSYFSKVFIKKVGISPGQYRKSGGNLKAVTKNR